jgi:hypothetical protein
MYMAKQKIASITNHKKFMILMGFCFILSSILILMSRTLDGFAQWYAVHIYPFFPSIIGRAFSSWHVSVFEIGILLFLILISFILTKGFYILIFRRRNIKAFFHADIRILACFLSVLFFVYTLTCGINYQREGIGKVLGLPVLVSSSTKLEKLSEILADELTELAEDPEISYSGPADRDYGYIEKEAVNAMKKLGEKEPSLSGYYPQPKPVYFSAFLSDMGIEGIFSPFTMEANYNNQMTAFLIPYTIAHELAHLKGYMKEDEAGFIAFLACKSSPSKLLQYSADFHALNFTLSALKAEVSPEKFNDVYQKLPGFIKVQLSCLKEQNEGKESSHLSVTKSFNNLYLLANAQSDGAGSYDRITDLLLAEYADQLDPDDIV